MFLCRRKEPIIAIGGGVCLDVAGLAANLYRRNTPLIKVPTTVMAAVDASIGIKTAVNFHGRKNKMGTYAAPLAVFIDKTFLNTLGDRHLSNGSAEILKMACIKDAELFELLEKHSAEVIKTKFQVSISYLDVCCSSSSSFLPAHHSLHDCTWYLASFASLQHTERSARSAKHTLHIHTQVHE